MGLRETVDYFGIIASEFEACFASCKLGAPQSALSNALSIRLRAPISLTNRMEVAMRFVDPSEQGMLFEIKHNEYGNNQMKGFPCSCLSNCCGEEEILFIG